MPIALGVVPSSPHTLKEKDSCQTTRTTNRQLDQSITPATEFDQQISQDEVMDKRAY